MSKKPVVLPAASLEWEVWRWRRDIAAMEGTVPDPALAGDEAIGIGLSAGELLLIPLWLTSRDATLFDGLILSQLEKRGLASRGGAAAPIFDYVVVAEEESRVLVRVALLAVNFPANLALSQASFYASAADLLPLPEHQLTLWMERQHLVVTATLGEEAVYQQVISRSPVVTAGIVAELGALRIALEAEGTVKRIAGVTLWHTPDQRVSGVECLSALGLPVHEQERPAPAGPRVERALARVAARARLVPHAVQASRRAQSRQQRLMRYAAIVAAVYVGLAFLLWAWQLKLKREATALGEKVKEDQPTAATLEKAAAAWRALEPAIDPSFYALEQFHQIAGVLPPVGMRFTAFEIKGDVVIIRGTARNAPEVFRYTEALRQHRTLPRYLWKVGQPRVLKDDTAEFKIEGKRH